MKELCGIINVYKEKGFTSHDVVNVVRGALNRAKTGHTGTLDPDAEGVLPICVGKATKLADFIMADIKEYIAELTLGVTTTTQDLSGNIIEEKEVKATKEEITSAVLSFQGEIYQTPPMYSAIKVNGKKLYELAREGKEIERKQRLVNIYELEILEFISYNKLKIRVLCSKGTYIRALCNDIGQKLGCGGAMSELLRTRSGQFRLENSLKLEKVKELAKAGNYEAFILSPEEVMPELKKFTVSSKADKFLMNGNKISTNFVYDFNGEIDEKVFIYDSNKRLIGIYQVYDGFIKPLTMLI